MVERCEWCPDFGVPAIDPPRAEDCPNEATLLVGTSRSAHGDWHLCARCAALPVFNRHRKRVPLRKTEVSSG